jgi:hypothetical protein
MFSLGIEKVAFTPFVGARTPGKGLESLVGLYQQNENKKITHKKQLE